MPCMCGDSECASCGCAQGTRSWTDESRWRIRARTDGGGMIEIEVNDVGEAMDYHALLAAQGATQITSERIPVKTR